MWIFLSGGALMPAMVPVKMADPKWTEDGRFDLQVRARVESHLDNFVRDFMEEGTYNPTIQASPPHMDYQFRLYTTQEAFGQAMAKAIMAIDYISFKDTADDLNEDKTPKYVDGKEYHSALYKVWSAVFSNLGKRRYSAYTPSTSYLKGGAHTTQYRDGVLHKYYGDAKPIGSTFTPVYPKSTTYYGSNAKSVSDYAGSRFAEDGDDDIPASIWADMMRNQRADYVCADCGWDECLCGDEDDDDNSTGALFNLDSEDWVPSRQMEADLLHNEFRGIPAVDIEEELSERELKLLREFYPGMLSPVKRKRRTTRRHRNNRRRTSRQGK